MFLEITFNEFITNNLKDLISSIVVVVVCILIIIISKIITKRIIKKAKLNRKRTATITKMLYSIIKYVVAILMVIVVLGIWGLDLGPVLAGAGILALVVGLGAQDLIKDLIAGFSIVFENYYDIEDVVEIDGFKGTVFEIGLKSTKIVDYKGNVKIITNGDIGSVINFSRNPTLAIVDIGISYDEDENKVIELLEEHIGTLKDTYSEIIEGPNVVGVVNLSDSSVVIRITAKVGPEEHYAIERAIKKFVLELFKENNIEIPYQQVVVHNGKDNN